VTQHCQFSVKLPALGTRNHVLVQVQAGHQQRETLVETAFEVLSWVLKQLPLELEC